MSHLEQVANTFRHLIPIHCEVLRLKNSNIQDEESDRS